MFEALGSATFGLGRTIWPLVFLFAMEILVVPVVVAIVIGCSVGLVQMAEVLIGALRTQTGAVTGGRGGRRAVTR